MAALLALAACAQPSRAPQMTVHNVMTPALAADADLAENFAVGDVGGGRETDPLWTPQVSDAQLREALERSLEHNGMRAARSDFARYIVSARIVEFERPVLGLAMRVSPLVAYRVVDRADAGVIYGEELRSSYTVSFAESVLGIERLRLANEGAIRENIREFLNRFREAWIARASSNQDAPRPAAAAPSS